MATLHQVQAALQEAVSAALVGLSPTPSVGIGWPSVTSLQNNVRNGAGGLVTVYDRKFSKDSTRWAPALIGQTVIPATLESVVSFAGGSSLPPINLVPAIGNTVAVIALSGTPTVGDAVSCIITPNPAGSAPQAVVVNAGVDAPTTAGLLATAINTNMSTFASAVASGANVTLTAKVSCRVQSFTGNGGTNIVEIARRDRRFQIVLWARTELLRQAIGDPLEVMIANLQVQNGLLFPDGTMGRVLAEADYYLEDATLYDTYRRDFMLSVDYPITSQDAAFAVLAPVLDLETQLI